MKALLFIGFSLIASISSWAQTTVVNTNDVGAGSLRDAVTNASAGALIVFDASLTGATIDVLSEIIIPADITIDGGSHDIKLNGLGGNRIFYTNGTYNIGIKNITIKNGGSVSSGGGIYTQGGASLTLSRVRFIDCNTSNDGGAIRTEGGTQSFYLCEFIGNSGGSWGGAFYKLFGSAYIENCLFSGNAATNGGAVFLRSSTDNIINCTFAGNRSNNAGGALYLYGITVNVKNSIFWNNQASGIVGNAGAYYAIAAGTVIVNTEVSNIQGSGGSGSWTGTYGTDLGGNIDANPSFANVISPGSAPTTAGNYRPQLNSPSHNMGVNAYSTVFMDLDKHNRIMYAGIDHGAYEFCTTYDTIAPVVCASYSSPAGNIYTTSGIYYDTLVNSLNCDSVIVIYLSVNNTYNILTPTVCNSYTSPGGSIYTTSGTYEDTIPNSNGCDSVFTIHLTVNNTTYNGFSASQCVSYLSPSGNYTWMSSGTYTDTLINSAGCDSIITVSLTILQPTSNSISLTACDSLVSPSGNYTYVNSGVYSDTLINTAGCDSVITIYLSVFYTSYNTINLTSCDSLISPSGLYTYTTSGTYTDTLSNVTSCDSIITINLTINNTSFSSFTDTSCGDYISPGGYIWTTSGTYVDTIVNISGCDSIITVDLTVIRIDTILYLSGSAINATQSGDTYQWIDCIDSSLLEGKNESFYTPVVSGTYALIITQAQCVDTTDCFPVEIEFTKPPNAYSPDGDGINDKWIIPSAYSDLNNEVFIYNRWGDIINSFTGYNNNEVVWSGDDKKGNALPSGTYFYSIKLPDTDKVLSGWVQITK